MRYRTVSDKGSMNLVASDLFFGLGAIMLVLLAALSLGLRGIVSQALADRSAKPDEVRQAVAELAAARQAPVLLADSSGLHRLAGNTAALIALDDLWAAEQLSLWLADDPLLVVTASGEDAAFLVFSRAATLSAAPIVTLRLTQNCKSLAQSGETFVCNP